jgi:hypothetical protein
MAEYPPRHEHASRIVSAAESSLNRSYRLRKINPFLYSLRVWILILGGSYLVSPNHNMIELRCLLAGRGLDGFVAILIFRIRHRLVAIGRRKYSVCFAHSNACQGRQCSVMADEMAKMLVKDHIPSYPLGTSTFFPTNLRPRKCTTELPSASCKPLSSIVSAISYLRVF